MKNDNDLTDTILNIAAGFDWITPLWAILQDLSNGPVAKFGVMAGLFSRDDIRRILHNHGLESWGYIYNMAGDLIIFSVPERQVDSALYILEHEGVPVLYAPASVAESETVLNNTVEMGTMTIVPAPSFWRWLRRLSGKAV